MIEEPLDARVAVTSGLPIAATVLTPVEAQRLAPVGSRR